MSVKPIEKATYKKVPCDKCHGVGCLKLIYDYETRSLVPNGAPVFASRSLIIEAMLCYCENGRLFHENTYRSKNLVSTYSWGYYGDAGKAEDYLRACRDEFDKKQV